MKAQKGLKLLFDAVLAEAKENPAFARRIETLFAAWAPPARRAPGAKRSVPKVQSGGPPVEDLHPTRDIERLGEDGLRAALAARIPLELLALLDAHNLDPAGKMMAESDPDVIAAFIVSAAKKKIARDRKAFDY